MKLSRQWLAELVPLTDIDNREFAERMTMSGSKVEVTDDLRSKLKNMVIGQVTNIVRHEDSDHLWVCTINVSPDASAEPLTIVTGAQNVKQGDIVPVALHNSVLPDGTKITKGKIRGVKSDGMLCGLEELGLDLHDFPFGIMDGILILSDEPALKDQLTIGADASAVLGYDDAVVEFEITNNRPDCLSVRGLAREAAVTFDVPLTLAEPKVSGGVEHISEYLKVFIADEDLCSRYTAKVVKNVKIAPSPLWLRQRLRASGVRPINNIVDVTNYVMLEYGQPMHAFDFACVDGSKITVRRAASGENMNTLDGSLRKLNTEMLVIADDVKAIGIAGVMGGENSEITDDTKAIVLESATFSGQSVRKTALTLNMRTDASSRFEKGLDAENTLPAVQRACELIELLGAGEVVAGIVDERSGRETHRLTLDLEPLKINALIGMDIDTPYMLETLRKLGFEPDSEAVAGESVTVPSWRADIEHWTDLAEEVARFYGFDKVTEQPLVSNSSSRGLTRRQKFKLNAAQLSRAAGYNELVTFSLRPEGGLRVINPLGEDKAYMRVSLLPSALEVVEHNRNHGTLSGKLFELGRVYLPKNGEVSVLTLPDERAILLLTVFGKEADFFALKADVELILTTLDAKNVTFKSAESSAERYADYHPGRCAEITVNGEIVGVCGQLHPANTIDVFTAEIDVTNLLNATAATTERQYKQLPLFPAITRDLSFADATKDTPFGDLSVECFKLAKPYLREFDLFDRYKNSFGLRLTFRADERTLIAEEINPVVDRVVAAVTELTGATLRS